MRKFLCVVAIILCLISVSSAKPLHVVQGVANGTTDDAATIQSALDAAAADSGAVFLPPGTYFINADLVVDSEVEVYGVYGATILKRGSNPSNVPRWTGANNCATDSGSGYIHHGFFVNTNYNCGDRNISIHDLVLDGSAMGTKFCTTHAQTTCPGGGFCGCTVNGDCQSGSCSEYVAPNAVAVDLSAITGLQLYNLIVRDVSQDAIFVKGGGSGTRIHHNTITNPLADWGNGGGINVEIRSGGNMVGAPEISDNYILVNSLQTCELDLTTPCDSNMDCTDAYPDPFVPADDCTGVQLPIYCCTGAGQGQNCNRTCRTGAASKNAIAVTWYDGTTPARTTILRNLIDVSDHSTGIACNGCQDSRIEDNTIRGTATRTTPSSWSGFFTGVSMNANAGGTVKNNQILRNSFIGTGTSGDRYAILVMGNADSSGIAVIGNQSTNKSFAYQGFLLKGIDGLAVASNIIHAPTSSASLMQIGETALTTAHVTVAGNTLRTDAGTGDNLELKIVGTTRVHDNIFTGGNVSGNLAIVETTSTSSTTIGPNTFSNFNSTTPFTFLSGTTLDHTRDWTQATLPTTVDDGSVLTCTDCTSPSNPCTGSGAGATATRTSGAWVCG